MTKPTFAVAGRRFLLNGKPVQIRCGELHYPRIPRAYWRHRLQLARAMGLNAICTYLFWNRHEMREGHYDFRGNLDVAAFLQMAQDEGLHVLVRPGPYVCSEWDFGGLPWWLLKTPDIKVRCQDPRYLRALDRFVTRAAQELVPLQVTRGGPLLMVQVENEYGAYGNDHGYLRHLQSSLTNAGFDVPLFRCDWANPQQLLAGAVPGVTTVANFGSNPGKNIETLKKCYPHSPPMSGEYWMGWFDRWGAPRNGRDRADGAAHVQDIQWMLEHQISFSMYMFHGGTNFGFNSGANDHGTYEPTVTSYDFWAPIDESGRPREKYFKLREIIARATGMTPRPVPPAVLPRIALPRFPLPQIASLIAGLRNGIRVPQPLPMEYFDQANGCILYRTDLAGRAVGEGELRVRDVHDNAWVFLNGQLLGAMDRRLKQDSIKITIPGRGKAVLDILVEGMGRVNFGPRLVDRKGITDRVEFGRLTLMDWEVFPLPLDASHLRRLQWRAADLSGPVFRRGVFTAPRRGDTFLDLRGWGKGYVWINGHNLGRYWHIGPQQTLFLPGAWLKKGPNTCIVLDLENRCARTLAGLDEPILDEVEGQPVPL